MTTLKNTWRLMLRDIRSMLRQPWFVAITIIQPAIWLLLFGALFKKVVQIPGFNAGSYTEYLAPGVVVMTAIFFAGWVGMSDVEELDRGTMDRFLTSPVNRAALIVGRVGYAAVAVVVQTAVIVVIALLVGARFHNGVVGVVGLLLFAALLGSAFAALSCGMGLLTRQRESLIGFNSMLMLPLTFLSTACMQKQLMPDWMQHVVDYNPVNWAIDAGRVVSMQTIDWGIVVSRAGWLLAFTAVAAAFATTAFRSYQRSV
jgi:ABC-2 type transport system permease protein